MIVSGLFSGSALGLEAGAITYLKYSEFCLSSLLLKICNSNWLAKLIVARMRCIYAVIDS